MKHHISILLVSICGIMLFSCSGDKTEANLDTDDRAFLEQLGILHKKETIELFDTNGGWKGMRKAGSLITSDRIAYYWLGGDEPEIYFAFFNSDIDSMNYTDLHTKLTYASYITVYETDGSIFKVYIDGDSARVHTFFNKAESNWVKYRTNK